jgi:hypothetical protein
MRDLLINKFQFPAENILVLSDNEATRTAILHGIEEHLGQADSAGLAFLLFSGHGAQLDSDYSIPSKPSGDQALFVWDSGGKATIILDDEVGYELRALSAGRVLFVVDACFSGTMYKLMAREGSARVTYVAGTEKIQRKVMSVGTLEPGPGVVFPSHFVSDGSDTVGFGNIASLSASDEDHSAWTLTNWPTVGTSRSVFGYFLDRVLAGALGGETPSDVASRVTDSIGRSTACLKHQACETPVAGGTQAQVPLTLLLGGSTP